MTKKKRKKKNGNHKNPTSPKKEKLHFPLKKKKALELETRKGGSRRGCWRFAEGQKNSFFLYNMKKGNTKAGHVMEPVRERSRPPIDLEQEGGRSLPRKKEGKR